MHFAHHVIGELDEIWVSPHYYQHAEYARALNHVDIQKKAIVSVPYVWDSQVLLGNGERHFQWKPSETDTFLILEPNISFQKCSLVPLMILEAWFRKNPDWKGEVVIINGERLNMIPFFKESIWNTLDIVKAGRVKIRPRMDILTLLKEFPSAIPICHQINNEYNYMILEYFISGYPVLHNAPLCKDLGYYYENSDTKEGAKMLNYILTEHDNNISEYHKRNDIVLQRYHADNQELIETYDKLIYNLFNGGNKDLVYNPNTNRYDNL